MKRRNLPKLERSPKATYKAAMRRANGCIRRGGAKAAAYWAAIADRMYKLHMGWVFSELQCDRMVLQMQDHSLRIKQREAFPHMR